MDAKETVKTLLSPRWLAGHLLMLTLVVLFINLGFWQVQRLEHRREENARISARLEAGVQPYSVLKSRYSATANKTAQNSVDQRQTRLTGRYDPQHELLWRSAGLYQGHPGYYLLTPLVIAPGRAILVDRGWVPIEMNTPPIGEAAPPKGNVTLEGRLRVSQPQPATNFAPKDPAEGKLSKVFWLTTARLEKQMPYRLEPVFLVLDKQTPKQSEPLPIIVPPEPLTEGSHLSYAMQWFSFALIGIIGYFFLLRSVLKNQEKEARRRALTDQAPSILTTDA